jgi:uncharacterized membrane protein YbhN (UPF0104 family)
VAFLSVALTLAAGVARWRLLFYPDHHARSWPDLAYAVLIGQTVNILLPLRFGELARAGLLSACPVLSAVATPSLSGHYCGADCLFGRIVSCINSRAMEKSE